MRGFMRGGLSGGVAVLAAGWLAGETPAPLETGVRLAGETPAPLAVERSPMLVPPAMIDGAPVEWEELTPMLAEAAGSVILEEIALGRAFARACEAEGVAVTPEMVDRERAELARAMGQAGLTPEEQAIAVQRVLASRGIGDVRLQALLERNAMLRALAARGLVATEVELREALDVLHGERVRARIIVCATRERMGDARARVEALTGSGADLAKAFAVEAKASSIDPSAARGGELELLSVRDRRYPEALREALAATSPGQVSPPFNFAGGWAMVLVEGRVPPDGVGIEDARPELERLVLGRKERLRMQEIGESLEQGVVVDVADPALRWSWRTRREGAGGR